MKTTKQLFGILIISFGVLFQVQAQFQLTNLVSTLTMTFEQAQNLATPVLSLGGSYFFRVTGRYGTGPGDRGEAMADAAYGTIITSTLDQYHNPGHAWLWNGTSTNRPSPDAYQSNHIYSFYFVGRGAPEVLSFTDSPYGDNVGALTFELYEISATRVFQIVFGQFTWDEAKTDAESRGGHLATFSSQTEWNLAQTLISQFNQDVWIGGYQPVASPEPAGNWSWVTGEPWTFSFWWPGEPNQNQGINENALMVGWSGAGWNDAPSSTKLSYVLESGPRVGLIKAVKPAFDYLAVGTNYQLQVSGDLNTWTNQGSAFSATNSSMVYPQYWDVDNWSQLFFRLQSAP